MHIGVIDSAVPIWHRCDFRHNLCEALATFKGNIYRKNIHRPIVLHYTYNFHTQKMGVNWRSFFVTAESLTPLWQKSAITKLITHPYWKRLKPVSHGPRGSCLIKKNQRSKISCQGPFKNCDCSTYISSKHFKKCSGSGLYCLDAGSGYSLI
jgi:hypothetical protein